LLSKKKIKENFLSKQTEKGKFLTGRFQLVSISISRYQIKFVVGWQRSLKYIFSSTKDKFYYKPNLS